MALPDLAHSPNKFSGRGSDPNRTCESAPKLGATSRMEITGAERRWRWSLEERLRIVAETEQAGADIAKVARKYKCVFGATLLASNADLPGSYRFIGECRPPGAVAHDLIEVGVPLPGLMVWVAIFVELGAGVMLLVGCKTQWAAGLLAWSLITGFAVHLVAGISGR